MKILILFSLFILIFNYEYQLECFKPTTASSRDTYFYMFKNENIGEEIDIYFYFKFISTLSNKPINLEIIDENQNETSIDNIINDEKWINFKLSNLTSQKYTIKINTRSTIYMYFIDSTKEINTNIDTFINLFFKTDLLGDKQPLPLTFNIDEIGRRYFL